MGFCRPALLSNCRGVAMAQSHNRGTGALPVHCLCMSHVLGQAHELSNSDLQRKL